MGAAKSRVYATKENAPKGRHLRDKLQEASDLLEL